MRVTCGVEKINFALGSSMSDGLVAGEERSQGCGATRPGYRTAKAVGDRMMRVLFGFVIFLMGNAVAQGEDANLER